MIQESCTTSPTHPKVVRQIRISAMEWPSEVELQSATLWRRPYQTYWMNARSAILSDNRLHACIFELGVLFTKELGFHQLDVHGNAFGLMATHPLAPFISNASLG